MSQGDIVRRAVAALNEAMLDDAHWPVASARLEEACGATSSSLVVGEGFDGNVRVHFAEFYSRGERRRHLEDDYFAFYHAWDERLPRVRRLPDSRIVPVRDLYTPEEIRTSPTYNEALVRSGNQRGLNVRLDGPDGLRIVWALGDPEGPGAWASSRIDVVRSLLPLIRQLVRVRQALSYACAVETSLTGLLENAGIGAIQLDHRGRIVEANDRARRTLATGDGLLDQDGFLRARLPADNARLQFVLSRALPAYRHVAVSDSTAVRRPPGQPRLVVHVNPVVPRPIDLDSQRVAAVVLVEEPGANLAELDPQLVAQALGISPSESRVAVQLAEGRSVQAISAATGRSQDAIRWSLKQMYRKLGLARQTDLVRLVLSTAPVSPRTADEEDPGTRGQPT